MRKVLIPIQIKLISFFIIILAMTMSFYVYYAVDLFEKDKSAYVFEAVKNQNESLSKGLLDIIGQSNKNLQIIENLIHSPIALKSFFYENQNIVSFFELKKQIITKDILSEAILKQIDKKSLYGLIKKLNLKTMKGNQFISLKNKYLLSWHKKSDTLNIILSDISQIEDKVGKSLLYSYFLKDQSSMDNILTESLVRDLPPTILNRVESFATASGSFVEKIAKKRYIVSFQKLVDGIYFYTLVEEEKAFEASSVLKRKSLFFGAFIASITVLLVMLFSKIFTGPIEKLFQASQRFSKNEFEHKVELSNKDELGVLADSFNLMSDSIITYMGEMKEKHRLESEMQTAKIVQDSFFPDKEIIRNEFELASFYSPATECGGDWWGKLEIDNKLVLIMIDATGHGTPAALVTAITHNTLTTIKEIIKTHSDFLKSSINIMNLLNQSICNIHNDMMATGFVGILDLETKEFHYTNASHNPPLLLEMNNDKFSKENIIPLMQANGARLGQNLDEVYNEEIIKLKSKDKIIFYTDGLIEGENPDGKAWGKRPFNKILIQEATQNIELLVNKIIQEAKEYYQEKSQDDDITIVGIEIK